MAIDDKEAVITVKVTMTPADFKQFEEYVEQLDDNIVPILEHLLKRVDVTGCTTFVNDLETYKTGQIPVTITFIGKQNA